MKSVTCPCGPKQVQLARQRVARADVERRRCYAYTAWGNGVAACELKLELDQDPASLCAGDTVSGTLVVFHDGPVPCELAVLSLVAQEVVVSDQEWRPPVETGLRLPPLDGAGPTRVPFNVQLPSGPLSYQGKHYSLSWVLRAQLWTQDGNGERTELPLVLGPAPVSVEREAPARRTSPAAPGRAHPIAKGISLFFSAAVTLAAAVGTFFFFPGLWEGEEASEVVVLVSIGVGLVAGIPVYAGLAAFFHVDLGAPVLSVSPSPAQPGEPVQVQLELAAPAPLAVREVRLRVVCEEHVRRTLPDGTRRPYDAILWERSVDLPGEALLSPGERRSFGCEVALPPDAARSMTSEHATVRWSAEATVHAGRLGQWTGQVQFRVGAEAEVPDHAPTPPSA